jgi:ribonuclease P protein component
MKTYIFPRSYRIRNSSEFKHVYDHGKAIRSRSFVMFYLDGDEEQPARLGITVTKRFGKANRRNRIKRLIREAFRVIHPSLKDGVDIVFNVRRFAEGISLKATVKEINYLFRKAGVMNEVD